MVFSHHSNVQSSVAPPEQPVNVMVTTRSKECPLPTVVPPRVIGGMVNDCTFCITTSFTHPQHFEQVEFVPALELAAGRELGAGELLHPGM